MKLFRPILPAAVFAAALLSAPLFAQTPDKTRPPHELADVTKIDPRLVLDIRYATANNFVKRPVYDQAKAFLHLPAAQALKRANDRLHEHGYGLIVYDAYRPLSVTRIFWEITPPDKKQYVADPKKGSRHNRGCAADVSLLDLATSQPAQMPSEFDDFSVRASHGYDAVTSDVRTRRLLLKQCMEAEGFKANPNEWWHYDYRGWETRPLLDIDFKEL